MNPSHEIIHQLVSACESKGIKYAVISPGSRNAPIVDALLNHSSIRCYSIVDERSAAFFALGLSQQSRIPTLLLCTSGTAVLNYAPALAEAYYQKVPLLAVTADRPLYMVNQGESQTIDQSNVFSNFIKGSFNLLQQPSGDGEKAYNLRLINQAIHTAISSNPGPVQVNLPLDEPLYERSSTTFPSFRNIQISATKNQLSHAAIQEIRLGIKQAEKIMILVGSMPTDKALETLLKEIAEWPSVVVLTETTGNVKAEKFIGQIDRVLAAISNEEMQQFAPDLLITFSDQVISKKIKQFLRKYKPAEHWHVDPGQSHFDTYQALTRSIGVTPFHFLESILPESYESANTYAEMWAKKNELAAKRHAAYLKTIPHSDLAVFDAILKQIPAQTVFQMGNSSAVRYVQLFEQNESLMYFSNRGTSGIEGCSSTAVGASNHSENLQLLICGELSFMYDSNAFWNKYVPDHLRVIVINNGGGGIFRIIEGPERLTQYEEFIATEHDRSVELLAKTYGLRYFSSNNLNELNEQLPAFFDLNPKGAAVLEIFTPKTENAGILRNYFKYITNDSAK